MVKMKLYFTTSNKNKLKEVKKILQGIEIIGVKLKVPEFQGSIEEVVKEKARYAYSELRKRIKNKRIRVIVDDTALCLKALKGLPGIYVKEFLDRIGNKGIINMLKAYKNKKAEAVCCIGYYDGKTLKIFKGIVKGKIVNPRKKENFLFGFDPIFMPKGYNKTFSQLRERKHEISHRKKALEKLKKFLEKH